MGPELVTPQEGLEPVLVEGGLEPVGILPVPLLPRLVRHGEVVGRGTVESGGPGEARLPAPRLTDPVHGDSTAPGADLDGGGPGQEDPDHPVFVGTRMDS